MTPFKYLFLNIRSKKLNYDFLLQHKKKVQDKTHIFRKIGQKCATMTVLITHTQKKNGREEIPKFRDTAASDGLLRGAFRGFGRIFLILRHR